MPTLPDKMNNQYSTTIGELVKGFTGSPIFSEVSSLTARGLALHHSQLEQGWVFVALKGWQRHGLDYLRQAQDSGAVAVLTEAQDLTQSEYSGSTSPIPIIPINDLHSHLPVLADRLFGKDKLQWLGITGTNGKSSVAHILAQSLGILGCKTAVVGTVYNGFPDVSKDGESEGYEDAQDTDDASFTSRTMTTPDILTLRRLGAGFQSKGAKCVAIECSSHALHQNRIEGLNINVGVFTNITDEHRDYHGDMNSYITAKRRLFQLPSLKFAVLNYDDNMGVKWHRELKDPNASLNTNGANIPCYTYGINNTTADICATQLSVNFEGSSAHITTAQGSGMLRTKILGTWGIANNLAALGVMLHRGYDLSDCLSALSEAVPLAGRMQKVESPSGAIFIVDYAHTPDALEKLLSNLKQLSNREANNGANKTRRGEAALHPQKYNDGANKTRRGEAALRPQGKLWVVFGCGGNRDREKRGVMGNIAANYADKVVLTNDNPRDEKPVKIIADIMAGITATTEVVVEVDRSKALELVLSNASADDVVVVAGKGHESYQEVAGERSFFNDYQYLQHRINQQRH